jgi:hypothetical protein
MIQGALILGGCQLVPVQLQIGPKLMLPDAVSCEPLLVSGEVIGSILVNHPDPPADEAHQRSLALAEIRAVVVAEKVREAVASLGLVELFISPARSARTPA